MEKILLNKTMCLYIELLKFFLLYVETQYTYNLEIDSLGLNVVPLKYIH